MGLRVDDDEHNDPLSTPKLSLSKLPCKPKHYPIQMLTPPFHPSLSIPFHWEEAPGKPRYSADEAENRGVGRCLDLPPRLSHDDGDELTMMPSPATVLDGPYMARSMSLACTFSFRKGLPKKKKHRGCGSFGRSRRWRSFKLQEEEEEEMSSGGAGGSFDFSQSLGDIFEREKKNAKRSGIRMVGSFFDLSSINSNLLDIYARFKQAIPWRRTK